MRNKTATFRFDNRDHEILNNLAKVRGQNKTQVLKRMLREEEARESEREKISRELDSFIQRRLLEIASERNADLAEGIKE